MSADHCPKRDRLPHCFLVIECSNGIDTLECPYCHTRRQDKCSTVGASEDRQ